VKHIEWLRDSRKSAEITQAQLALALKQPQSYVAKVERLERRLDVLEYVLWTHALKIDPAAAVSKLSSSVRRVRIK
jgi:transcriptional regulator with XRE-family HTH domain